MPKFTRRLSKAEDRTPIGVYDGPIPPDGTYAGILRSVKIRTSKTETPIDGYNCFVTLDAHNKDGDHAQYDGYGTFTTVWISDNPTSESREKSFLIAVSGKADVDVLTDDKVSGDPVVTKIGGKSPSGVRVLVKLETDRKNPQFGQSGAWIFPDPKANNGQAEAAAAEEDEPESEVDVVAEEKPKRTRKAPAKKAAEATVTNIRKDEPAAEDEYDSMSLPKLRAAARKAGIDGANLDKAELIAKLRGGGEEADGYKKNRQDILKMSDADLNQFILDKTEYEVADFAEMSRDETADLLEEDDVITAF